MDINLPTGLATEHAPALKAKYNERKCKRCGQIKPLTSDFFAANSTQKYSRGFQWTCKKCASARATEWNKKHRTAERRKLNGV